MSLQIFNDDSTLATNFTGEVTVAIRKFGETIPVMQTSHTFVGDDSGTHTFSHFPLPPENDYEMYYIGTNITTDYIPFHIYRYCQDDEDPIVDNCAPKIYISLATPVSSDLLLSHQDVLIIGSTLPNAFVNIILTGDTSNTIQVQSDINGNYSHLLPALSVGNYILEAHVLAANKTTSLKQEKIYFSVQKPLITMTSPTVGETLYTNVVVAGTTLPAIPNTPIKIVLNGTDIFTSITDTNGVYAVDIGKLNDGSHSVSAYLLDSSGNSVAEVEAISFSSKKIEITITTPYSPNGNVNNTELTYVGGETAPNMSVQVVHDGDFFTSISNSNGHYGISIGQLSDGDHSVIAYVLDENGDKIAHSDTITFFAGYISITSPTHNEILNYDEVIVTGKASPNRTIHFVVDYGKYGNYNQTPILGMSDHNGNYSINLGTLSQGSHKIHGVLYNDQNNPLGGWSDTRHFHVLQQDEHFITITSPIENEILENTSDPNRITITGTVSDPKERVDIRIYSRTQNPGWLHYPVFWYGMGTNNWSYSTVLPEGDYTIHASLTNISINGDTGIHPETDIISFSVVGGRTTGEGYNTLLFHPFEVTSPQENDILNNKEVTISGKAFPNTSISGYIVGKNNSFDNYYSVTSDIDGNWEYTTILPDGQYYFSARVRSGTLYTGSPSISNSGYISYQHFFTVKNNFITLDTPIQNQTLTNNTFTVSGTATAKSLIMGNVYDTNQKLVSFFYINSNASGNYSHILGLSDGEYTVQTQLMNNQTAELLKTSDKISFSVQGGFSSTFSKETVQISTPSDGNTFTLGDTITVTGETSLKNHEVRIVLFSKNSSTGIYTTTYLPPVMSDTNGIFTTSLPTNLQLGEQSIYAEIAHEWQSGNFLYRQSDKVELTILAKPQHFIHLTSPTLNEVIKETTVTLSGNTVPNSLVGIVLNNHIEKTITSDANGAYSLKFDTLSDNMYDARVMLLNSNGDLLNPLATTTAAFSIYTFVPTPPAAPIGENLGNGGGGGGYVPLPPIHNIPSSSFPPVNNIVQESEEVPEMNAAPEDPEEDIPKSIENILEEFISDTRQEPAMFECTLSIKELEIPAIRSFTDREKTRIEWDDIPLATAYHIYKKDDAGNMHFIAEVRDPFYEILLSSTLTYEDFGVKAIVHNDHCDINPHEYSITNIKTGPGDTLLIIYTLLLMLTIGGIYLYFTKKQA